MNKIKDWFDVEHDVDATERKVTDVFRSWYRRNVVVTHGQDRTVELTFGFPYTSSSDMGAGIWNVSAEALLKEDLKYRFKGLLLSENLEVIALFEAKPFEFKEIVIGKIERS